MAQAPDPDPRTETYDRLDRVLEAYGVWEGCLPRLEDAAWEIEQQRPVSKDVAGHHALCKVFADAADAIDAHVLADRTTETFVAAITEAGVPPWAAKLAGAAIQESVTHLFEQALPTQRVCFGLRVLGLLVCPDTTKCTVSEKLEHHVMAAVRAQAAEQPS